MRQQAKHVALHFDNFRAVLLLGRPLIIDLSEQLHEELFFLVLRKRGEVPIDNLANLPGEFFVVVELDELVDVRRDVLDRAELDLLFAAGQHKNQI